MSRMAEYALDNSVSQMKLDDAACTNSYLEEQIKARDREISGLQKHLIAQVTLQEKT